MNRRSVAGIDLLFPHAVDADEGGGWHVEPLGDGELVVRFLDGREVTLAIEEGDLVVALGDDLYVAPRRRGR